MKNTSISELKQIAIKLRKSAVTMIYEAQSGHPDFFCCCSMFFST